jgi:EamA-like transporter family
MGTRRSIPAAKPAAPRPADLRANPSAATAAVLLGASVVAVRVAVRDIPPISLAALRIGQGGLLLAAILLAFVPALLRVRRERLHLLALLGLLFGALVLLPAALIEGIVAALGDLDLRLQARGRRWGDAQRIAWTVDATRSSVR